MLHMRCNSIFSLDSVATGVSESLYLSVLPAVRDFCNYFCEISLKRGKRILSHKARVFSWKQVDNVAGGDWDLVLQNTPGLANSVCPNTCFKTCTFPSVVQKKMSVPRSGSYTKGRDGKNDPTSAPQIPSLPCSCRSLTSQQHELWGPPWNELFYTTLSTHLARRGLNLDLQGCQPTHGPGESFQGIPLPLDDTNKHPALTMLSQQL